ncbi:DUF3685 domain-containing protein [Limnoraphis robusta]|uniref:DUF3685 domain-containing protein n=1 Tax=Limnoraphis robusta CCNP1315 TaxID=3110306 RepID=A0ABU5U1T4_9CYAN|nr:DUF3685 domain-containing protein [Limnoraphis robusta]MEA5520965.1 DUF3685 domain-containing protein [Limnoraphis robusta CCNP1315]MEA5543642.1 DUF3685 domain-containing protein [Limnoraphis robusta CCNP1324]
MTQSTVRLLLIDDDPIFCMGLRAACEQYPDLQVVAEAQTAEAALAILEPQRAVNENSLPNISADHVIDVAVLELGMASLNAPNWRLRSTTDPAIAFCQSLMTNDPNLGILLLTSIRDNTQLQAAQQVGVQGYCPKGVAIETMITAIRLIANGQTVWENFSSDGLSTRTQSPITGLSRWSRWRYKLGCSGLQQIDETLAEVTTQLPNPYDVERGDPMAVLNWLMITGHRRELLAARWIVSQLLPASVRTQAPATEETNFTPNPPPNEPLTPKEWLVVRSNSSLTYQAPVLATEVKSVLFDVTFAKLQSGLINLTGSPLEIDILRLTQKRELICLILQQFEQMLNELGFSQVEFDQLSDKSPTMLVDIWKASVTNFLGKYYTLQVGTQEIEVVPVLLRDAVIVQTSILDKIPLVPDLVAHLLFQVPLIVDNNSCPVGSPEAMQRAEAILQNLVIQMANAVIQPLLNHFADVEELKQKYYDRRLLSTRELEKFRNNLSWKYRIEQYFGEPKEIFESLYTLRVFGERGIQKQEIYSPRNEELKKLSGVQLAVSLVLETRDAVAPRVRSTISFLGSGVVYLLTQVVGRGIGLIGRGILQGIGNSLQENRVNKKNGRQP